MDEIAKHRKKSKSSDKSQSSKRSDHKHQYEKVICLHSNWATWNNRCKICGRMGGTIGFLEKGPMQEELYKPVDGKWFNRKPLNVEELREKFPGVEIYKAFFPEDENGKPIYEIHYELVKE